MMTHRASARAWLLLLTLGASAPFACETRDTGGFGGSGGVVVGTGGTPNAGGGGSSDPCEGVNVTEADCAPGSGNLACLCIEGSQPCSGLDEETCKSTKGATGFCEPIQGAGGSDTCPFAPPHYLGCASVRWDQEWNQAITCTHPPGQGEACCEAAEELVPDGWVECGGCDCTSGMTAADCPAGSEKGECCCHFPDSNPCEGLDQGRCTTTGNPTNQQELCHLVMGHAWDPTTMQPTGPEIYIGCRSQCVVEQPHGAPTCTHAADSTICGLAEDARIPDGWSTDCSVCTPQG